MMKTGSGSTDLTAGKQRGRPFEPGKSGNPAGRPLGTRNKVAEDFIKAIADDFGTYGASVIERVRQEKPEVYLRVIAGLVPQKFDVEGRLTLNTSTKEQRDAAVAAALRADS